MFSLFSSCLSVCDEMPDSAKVLENKRKDCGVMPIPSLGCRVSDCKDGKWVEDCKKLEPGESVNQIKPLKASCGLKPLLGLGCRVTKCFEGKWQVECKAQGGSAVEPAS